MAGIRNLQLDDEDPKYETALGSIYDIGLVKPLLITTMLAKRGSFICCSTTHGYVIDLSLEDMVKLGRWWEVNKKQVFAEQKKKEEINAE